MNDATRDTRSRLLDAAEALILERGFAGATVDDMVEAAGVSKGAFFHHFSTKGELGGILLERYAERQLQRLQEAVERAEEVSGDPLVQILIALTLLEEGLRSEEDDASRGGGSAVGSLLANAAGHPDAFEGSATERARTALARRRALLAERLEAAIRTHPSSERADAAALADMLEALLEGSRLAARFDPDGRGRDAAARQLSQFRAYLELLFGVSGSERKGRHER